MRMMAWGRPYRLFGGGSGGGDRRSGRKGWHGEPPSGHHPSALKRRLIIAAVMLMLIGVVGVFVTDAILRPPLMAWASSRAVNVATQAISDAVRRQLISELDADSLFQTMTDAEGNLILIDYNMVLLNKIRADAAHYVQQELVAHTYEQLPLPLGLLTGVDFLAAYGPRLSVRIIPVGAVTTMPRSDFFAAGINVIHHRLYVHVRVVMRIVAPYIDLTVPVEQEIVLANQIIPGKVPNVFVGLEGMDLRQLQDGLLMLQGGGR